MPIDLTGIDLQELDLEIQLAKAGIALEQKRRHCYHMPWVKRLKLFYNMGHPDPYIPSPTQEEFHRSEARFKVLAAGARFGKSIAAPADIMDLIIQPGTHGWVCGPTYELAEKEWVYMEGYLEKLGLLQMATLHKQSTPFKLEFPWGSKIWQKSADNPKSLLGEELDWMILSEADQIKMSTWERFLRPRLGSRMGRVVIPATPFGIGIIKRYWDRGQLQDGMSDTQLAVLDWSESSASWQCSVIENPTFPVKEYIAASKEVPPLVFAEQYDGCFVQSAGRVYNEADPAVVGVTEDELLERLGITTWRNSPVYVGVDFGGTDPFVALLVVALPDDTWYVHQEHYIEPGATLRLAQHAERIGKMISGLHCRAIYADHDKADQHEIREELKRHKVRVMNARKGKGNDGLQPTIDELRHLFFQDKIFINRDNCPNTMRELVEYRWEDSRADDEVNNKPYPRDWANHAMDSCRYAITSARKYGGSLKGLDVKPRMPDPMGTERTREEGLSVFDLLD